MVQTNTTFQYKSLAREHNIQQWRQFLCRSINKTSLIKVLVGEWKLQRCRDMLQGIVCNLRRNLLQDDSRWMGGSGGAAMHPRRKQAPICFCMHCMLQNWFEGSHSRRHRCHVALSCFPKGYPLSSILEVRDTEPHTVCRHQQTGMVIGRQHMWQRNWVTCLYRLWHRERLRQSREAECPEAHEKGHNLPGDV